MTIDPLASTSADATASGSQSRPVVPALAVPRVGRFVVVRELGEGGMGVVYAAYDERLDRRVAIKLLHAGRGDERSQKRMQREAQALAKLSHPNVVQVYEVGLHEGAVFVAMEYIRGQTLREWLVEHRSVAEVVAAFVEAGHGLAAAHEAGLVHRDFKPDNCMRADDDGRVRVLDFGLARRGMEAQQLPRTTDGGDSSPLDQTLTRTGFAAGTPAYMAPEQFLGEELDARVDQFAFSVALWEALYGQRPFAGDTRFALVASVTSGEIRDPPATPGVPAEIEAALRRGLSRAADDRFPSMNELLAVLAADPARRGRRLRRRLGAVALLGGGIGVGTMLVGSDGPCDDVAHELDGLWDRTRADTVAHAFTETGLPYAEATGHSVIERVDRYVDAWVDARRDACEAHFVRGQQSAELLDQRVRCLDRRRDALAGFLAVMEDIDASVVERAVAGAEQMPPIDRCADADYVAQALPPPDDPRVAREVEEHEATLARVRALRDAARMEAAQTELDPALARAAELGYAPLDVAARLVQGELQDARSEYAAARETLEATYFDAHRLGADEVAAAASTALVAIVGAELSDPDAGAIWSRMAAATVDRAGIGPSPTLFDATAIVERARGRYEQAERLHRQAFELDEARGDELAAAGSLNGLAIDHQKLGRWKDALADSKRALEIFTRVLGAEHPKASAARLNMANVLVNLGRYDEAHVEAELATDNLVLVFGEVHAHVAAAETTVAFVHTASSRPDLALPHQLKAVEIYEQVHGPKHPWVGRALANVAGAQAALGHFEEAQAGFERALGILREALGPDHPDLALLASGLADVHVRRGDLQAAVSAYDESAALRARTVGEDHPGFGLVLDTRAEVLRRLGRMEEACRDHARALAIIGAKVGDEAFDMMGPHIGLAACARHDGDHAKAATHLRRAIAIAQKTMEAEDPRLLDLRAQLNALPVGPGG